MLYRQKFDTFIRIYDNVGYIVNKSDFGDRVVDLSGAIFLKVLSRKSQTLEKLCDEIAKYFIDVSPLEIENDVTEFYSVLEEDGLIVSGNSEEEINIKDARFSYSKLEPKTIKNDFTPIVQRATKTTQNFLEEHFKDKPQLVSLHIELTSRCNEHCLHCYIPHENKTEDINPALFHDILEQCRNMGVLSLSLSGGETMLHKNFCNLLRMAKEYDFSINILSNLTLLNDEIIKELKENRLSSVQVSLYSMDPDIHDSITRLKGSFYKTKDNILRLIDNDIPLQISCPTMKQNKNCFANVLKWANEHKVRAETDYIMMGRYDHTTDNLNNRLNLDEVGKVINDILKYNLYYRNEMLKDNLRKTDNRDISNDIVCGVCISSICMVANGDVFPCPGWQDYKCGNVCETPLEDIWKNSPKVQYLRNLRKKDFPECLPCPNKLFCSMCMVRNANEDPGGDFLKINKHFCNVAELNRDIVLDWKKKMNEA